MLKWAMILGGLGAIGCVGAFPLWILGVPGQPDVETPYVRGWKMGLQTLMTYPPIYIGLQVVYWLGRTRMTSSNREQWEQGGAIVFFLAFAGLVLRLIQSFSTLSKS